MGRKGGGFPLIEPASEMPLNGDTTIEINQIKRSDLQFDSCDYNDFLDVIDHGDNYEDTYDKENKEKAEIDSDEKEIMCQVFIERQIEELS